MDLLKILAIYIAGLYALVWAPVIILICAVYTADFVRRLFGAK